MEKEKIKDIAFFSMIALVVILSIYIIIYIRSESYECMSSPLTYGVSQFKTNLGQVLCGCNIKEESCTCSIPQSTETFLVTNESVILNKKDELPLFLNNEKK